MLTQGILKEHLNYDEETGNFTRKKICSNYIKVGQVAGSINDSGYIIICLLGKRYRAHHLAWLYMYGKFPEKHIDHKDLNKTNNKISNLREASKRDNALNTTKRIDNKSGYKGVSWNKNHSKWVAKTKLNGKYITLGLFHDLLEAAKAYADFAKIHHGEFINLS